MQCPRISLQLTDQTTNSPGYLKSRAHALWVAVADQVSFPEHLPTEALAAAVAPGNSAVSCVDSTLQILPTLSSVSKPSNKTCVSVCCGLPYQVLYNICLSSKNSTGSWGTFYLYICTLLLYFIYTQFMNKINIHELNGYFFNLEFAEKIKTPNLKKNQIYLIDSLLF